MSLPISIDEKKIKIIKDYPMLSLVILLLGVIGYLFVVIDNKNDKINAMQQERIIQLQKDNEKKDQLLDLWRDLGSQATRLNQMSIKKDTLR